MQFVTFILGVILGILVRDIKTSVIKNVEDIQQITQGGETKFFEPVTIAEAFKNAKSIDDILK